MIAINVGGQLFNTTRATLVSKSETRNFFDGLFEHSQPEGGAAYFIDRDPTLFQSVLHFARTGKQVVFNGALTVQDVRDELVFYGFLLPHVQPQEEPTDAILTVHIVGPAPGVASYVKAVQVDVFGRFGTANVAVLEDTLTRVYGKREGNPLELIVPYKSVAKFSLCLLAPSNDPLIAHLALNCLCRFGYELTGARSSSVLTDVEHATTESRYNRLDAVYHLARAKNKVQFDMYPRTTLNRASSLSSSSLVPTSASDEKLDSTWTVSTPPSTGSSTVTLRFLRIGRNRTT
jgi:hypothetical protein